MSMSQQEIENMEKLVAVCTNMMTRIKTLETDIQTLHREIESLTDFMSQVKHPEDWGEV